MIRVLVRILLTDQVHQTRWENRTELVWRRFLTKNPKVTGAVGRKPQVPSKINCSVLNSQNNTTTLVSLDNLPKFNTFYDGNTYFGVISVLDLVESHSVKSCILKISLFRIASTNSWPQTQSNPEYKKFTQELLSLMKPHKNTSCFSSDITDYWLLFDSHPQYFVLQF